MVAPGGGSTPPTITSFSSPPTWQPITVTVRSHLTGRPSVDLHQPRIDLAEEARLHVGPGLRCAAEKPHPVQEFGLGVHGVQQRLVDLQLVSIARHDLPEIGLRDVQGLAEDVQDRPALAGLSMNCWACRTPRSRATVMLGFCLRKLSTVNTTQAIEKIRLGPSAPGTYDWVPVCRTLPPSCSPRVR